MLRLAVAGSLFAMTLSTAAFAQQMLKNEPAVGGMRGGETVFVDNGKCPKGQVMKVTAGVMVGRMGSGGGGAPREKACVPRP